MSETDNGNVNAQANEEVADLLIAISVVAKRLAKKIQANEGEKECTTNTTD